MKKIILIILVVLAVYAYMQQDDIRSFFSSDRCSEEGMVWDPQQGACVRPGESVEVPPEDEQPAQEDLSGIERVVVALDAAVDESVTVARGDGIEPFSATFAQKGGASIDGIVTVNLDQARVHTGTGDVLAPYTVEYGGTGSFVSLGLFAHDGVTLRLSDSIEIGDRVPVDALSFEESDTGDYTVVVAYRSRRDTDPMVAEPTVARTLRATVENGRFDEPRDVSVADEHAYRDLIRVSAPVRNALVDSPLAVRGEARGPWYFEASFPVDVRDASGAVVGVGYATAEGDWMTESYVPFSGTIAFDVSADAAGSIGSVMFRKANASGLAEHDDALVVPVVFD